MPPYPPPPGCLRRATSSYGRYQRGPSPQPQQHHYHHHQAATAYGCFAAGGVGNGVGEGGRPHIYHGQRGAVGHHARGRSRSFDACGPGKDDARMGGGSSGGGVGGGRGRPRSPSLPEGPLVAAAAVREEVVAVDEEEALQQQQMEEAAAALSSSSSSSSSWVKQLGGAMLGALTGGVVRIYLWLTTIEWDFCWSV